MASTTRIIPLPEINAWAVYWETIGCIHGGHHFIEADAIEHAERLEIEAVEIAIFEEAAETGRSVEWVRTLDRLGVA